MNLDRFHGVICPLVTPFDEADRVDHGAVAALVEFLIGKGIHGVMPAGSTGEGLLLTLDERKALTEAVLHAVAGRCLVMAHVGCLNTADTVALARHAQAVGVDAISAIVPAFYSYDDESLFAHYVRVAEAAEDTPLFVYTFPGNAKNDISPALLGRLRQACPNLVGLKVSNPDLIKLQAYLDVGGPDLVLFCGVDGLMLPALALGARGQVSGNANVFPEPFCQLYAALQRGDLVEARRQQARINELRAVLHDGSQLARFKAALALRGLAGGRVRAPMRELTEAEREALWVGLQRLGAL